MTQHEIYTFPPGMRVYDENGVAQDPLAQGSGGGGGLLTSTKNLTQADILALPTTPFELVPAPTDPTKTNFPVAIGIHTSGGTPYTFGTANLGVGYASDPTGDNIIFGIPAGNLNPSGFPISYWVVPGSQGFTEAAAGDAIVLTLEGTVSGGTATAKITTLYFTG